MSTGQTLYVIKILLKHISEHPEDARTVASGALSMLDGALKPDAEHEPKKDKPKAGAPKKAETKSGAPRRGGRPPFDTGKLKALLRAGWDIPKIADEMQVTEATIRKHCREEGLLKDEQQADSV